MRRRRSGGRRRSQFCSPCQERILNSGRTFKEEMPPHSVDVIDGVAVCTGCRRRILIEKGFIKDDAPDARSAAIAEASEFSSIDTRLSSPRLIDRLQRAGCICGKEVVPLRSTDDKEIAVEPGEVETGNVLLVTAAMLADLWGTRVRARSDEVLGFVARTPSELAVLDTSPADQPRYRMHDCRRSA